MLQLSSVTEKSLNFMRVKITTEHVNNGTTLKIYARELTPINFTDVQLAFLLPCYLDAIAENNTGRQTRRCKVT